MEVVSEEKSDQTKIIGKLKSNTTCVNLKCESGSDVLMVPCPIFMLGMYNVKRTKKTVHPEICQSCFDSAVNETEVNKK